jgi:hypothetical protein
MEPAQSIISKLGGPSTVARVTGVHRTRAYKWQMPKEKGGTGGRIPQSHIPTILAYAREQGIELTAEECLQVAEAAA